MDKVLQNTIIAVLIIITIAVVYKFIIYPEFENSGLVSCVAEVEKSYMDKWNSYCKTEGSINNKEANCELPAERADELNEELKALKDDCFRAFK